MSWTLITQLRGMQERECASLGDMADQTAGRAADALEREMQRAEAAEARVAELEERLKGTLQAGGYQYFYEQLHAAEREAGNARYVAEQAQAKVAELEAQIAEVVGSQRNEDKSLPTWAQVMNRVALLAEQNARLRAALVRLDNIYRSELDGEDAPKRPAWLIAALNGEEAST